MNQLLSGGRPVLALAKDCCYRDISSLAEDLQLLQAQKAQIDSKYERAVEAQTKALDEMANYKEQNEKLQEELDHLKDVALIAESEANLSLDALHKRNTEYKLKLIESKKRIQQLEKELESNGGGNKKDLKTANMQIKFLQEQLQSSADKGKIFSLLDF